MGHITELFAPAAFMAENGAVRISVQPLVLLLAMSVFRVSVHPQARESSVPVTSSHAPAPEDRIDINHADIADLMKVPGMTSVWAKRIARFRPYRTKDELLDRGIVSSEVYERIKDYIIAHRDKQ
jgi:DNA uptake protein ComE-like DNA-binding protein